MNQDSGKFNIPRLLNFYIDNIIKGKEKDKSTEDEIDVSWLDISLYICYIDVAMLTVATCH